MTGPEVLYPRGIAMRFEITFTCDYVIRLPIHYNSIVQAMIYANISNELARKLHDIGYPYEERRFKLFTFSSLSGTYRLNRKSGEITFSPPVTLVISSPIEQFIYELGYSMLINNDLRLGENRLNVANLNTPPDPAIKTLEFIGMLSPITVYSTLKTAEGRSKTYYYSPYEPEFSELIASNLKKKYALIHKREAEEQRTISISPVKVDKRSEKLLKYKGTIIRAWRGVYSLEGDPDLIRIGYETGLGSKNPQGFGCFKFLKRGDKND